MNTPQAGGSSRFIKKNMAVFHEQDFIAGPGLGSDGDTVGHGSGGDEDGRFLAEQLSTFLFQKIDGRVFTHNVVSEGGGSHRLEHLFCRMGDRIGAEINFVVGWIHRSSLSALPAQGGFNTDFLPS